MIWVVTQSIVGPFLVLKPHHLMFCLAFERLGINSEDNLDGRWKQSSSYVTTWLEWHPNTLQQHTNCNSSWYCIAGDSGSMTDNKHENLRSTTNILANLLCKLTWSPCLSRCWRSIQPLCHLQCSEPLDRQGYIQSYSVSNCDTRPVGGRWFQSHPVKFPTYHDHEDPGNVLGCLSPLNYRIIQNDAISKHTVGTGTWFIEHPKFQGWLSGIIPVLCARGPREYLVLTIHFQVNNFPDSGCRKDDPLVSSRLL